VLVKPGDCLWLIAAQRLGPDVSPAEVAAAWPRWYASNERVIGADPSLIQPGELLQEPPDNTPQGDAR
jgi:nucleoid-associated protein YgaU